MDYSINNGKIEARNFAGQVVIRDLVKSGLPVDELQVTLLHRAYFGSRPVIENGMLPVRGN